jgi:hypothetical protein
MRIMEFVAHVVNARSKHSIFLSPFGPSIKNHFLHFVDDRRPLFG